MSNAASTPEFRKILQALYDSGKYRDSGSTLKAAWVEYHRRYGGGTVQQRRYAMRKTAEGMNPRNALAWYIGKRADDPETYELKKVRRPMLEPWSFVLGPYKTRNDAFDGFEEHGRDPRSLSGLKRSDFTRKKKRTLDEKYGLAPWVKHGSGWDGKRKRVSVNPIAVYNPRERSSYRARGIKLPASQIEIRYKRTSGKYSGKWFKHNFKSSIALLGMSDGSILLKSTSGKKLWGTV